MELSVAERVGSPIEFYPMQEEVFSDSEKDFVKYS